MLDASGTGGHAVGDGLHDQRRAALLRANEIRSARATLKLELRTGAVRLVDVLDDPPVWLLTAPVHDLLVAAPGIGAVRARRLLGTARISPSKRIEGLTERQRGELVASLGQHR